MVVLHFVTGGVCVKIIVSSGDSTMFQIPVLHWAWNWVCWHAFILKIYEADLPDLGYRHIALSKSRCTSSFDVSGVQTSTSERVGRGWSLPYLYNVRIDWTISFSVVTITFGCLWCNPGSSWRWIKQYSLSASNVSPSIETLKWSSKSNP